jgi:hypothetical protein
MILLRSDRVLPTEPGAVFRSKVATGWSRGLMPITVATARFGLWSSRRRSRLLAEAVVLMLSAYLIGPGCSGPLPETRTLPTADRLVLYEGLPHPMYEPQALAAERKSKATVTLHGFPLYQEPLELKPGDGERFKALLGDPRSFSPYSGEKKCGGFRPDYAVEWSAGGQVYQALICFGCFEAKIYGPGGETTYDVGRDSQGRFKELLQPYRRNRPPFHPGG